MQENVKMATLPWSRNSTRILRHLAVPSWALSLSAKHGFSASKESAKILILLKYCFPSSTMRRQAVALSEYFDCKSRRLKLHNNHLRRKIRIKRYYQYGHYIAYESYQIASSTIKLLMSDCKP